MTNTFRKEGGGGTEKIRQRKSRQKLKKMTESGIEEKDERNQKEGGKVGKEK